MADAHGGDKTEAPTQKRKDDAAKRGDHAQARELGPALVTLFGAVYLLIAGPALAQACADALRTGLTLTPGEDFEPARAVARIGGAVALPFVGLIAACCVGALLSGVALGGGHFRLAALAPDPSRLDPITGLGRLFGMRGPTELGKALLKLTVVGLVAYFAIRPMVTDLAPLAHADARTAAHAIGARATGLLLDLACGLGVIALVDTPLALFRHRTKLRMTKQEVRDEAKEQDGNPETKGAQRRRMREASRGPAAAAVASAHVVLTNPTHFAVALRDRRAEDRAPVVVARGRGQIAAAIRAAALEHALPILEYPELARALYFTGRDGAEIAPDLYAAVAAVLAFVFNLDRAAARTARAPIVDVPPSARFDEHGRRGG